VSIKKDGDMWCANRLPFTNLQECKAGFGASAVLAFGYLLEKEAAP
jgi:hypothetical protein